MVKYVKVILKPLDYLFLKHLRYSIVCGKSDVQPDLKIVGGVIAKAKSWPAHALVFIKYKTIYDFGGKIGKKNISCENRCGGTLINLKTVITAAHCLSKQLTCVNESGLQINFTKNNFHSSFKSIFTVYLGAHDISFLDTLKIPSTVVGINVSEIKKVNFILLVIIKIQHYIFSLFLSIVASFF